MSIFRSPSDFKIHLEAELPTYRKLPANVRLTPRDKDERPCAAYKADHYEVQAYYTTVSYESLDVLEESLRTVPGVYATTQVRRSSDRVTAKNVFTNPAWPPGLGIERRDRRDLRPQVLALVRDEKPTANHAAKKPLERSIFRCAECGNGSHLRGWAHVNIHGDVGPDGHIKRGNYEDDAFDSIIEESITCEIHGEGRIEKLIGGQYTAI